MLDVCVACGGSRAVADWSIGRCAPMAASVTVEQPGRGRALLVRDHNPSQPHRGEAPTNGSQVTGTSSTPHGAAAVARAWLDAHAVRDTEAELRLFAHDIAVIDDGGAHFGLDDVRAWLEGAATEYEYTFRVLGIEDGTDERSHNVVATARLEGNFPGGRVDLRYRFLVTHDRIHALTIAAV